MTIALFHVRCGRCGCRFTRPYLSDMAYGEFIFTGEKGTTHAYFCALDNSAWEYINSLCALYCESNKVREDQGTMIQDACAFFADAVEGQRLKNGAVCPHCQSDVVRITDNMRSGLADIPTVSFSDFLSQPEAERRRMVMEFFEEVHSTRYQ